MKLIRLFSLAALFVAALSLSGCVKGKKGGGGGGSTDGDYVNGSPLPDRQEGVSFLGSNVDRSKFRPVYFGSTATRSAAGSAARSMKSPSS
ncbi:MAG: hypothetical protein WDN28_31725 [Chthoniobacter sp.]